jgi:hypothetical protein
LDEEQWQSSDHHRHGRVQVEELEVADNEVVISRRYVNKLVSADAFARSRCQHL